MNQFKKTAIAIGVAQIAWMAGNAAMAQTAPAAGNAAAEPAVVIVSGQRAALLSAQKLKQNSDEIVDSIVADDIGKLPDRSVTEVLQRIVGVTIDRTMSKADPEHYSVEGSGVTIRGLTYVRSEMNGRDSYSANGGRSLNFEDVPPELMAGVDIYKNPSAEQIEGSIGGLVNLRTAMPFDFKGRKGAISAQTTYSTLKKGKSSPSASVLLSDRWKTSVGEFGALIDFAYSESGTRTDAFQVEPYYRRDNLVPGKTVWLPKGAQWRTLEFDRERQGAYGAFQWKKDKNLTTSLTIFKSKYEMQWDERAIFASSNPYKFEVSSDSTFDDKGVFQTGTLSAPSDKGIAFGADTRTAGRQSDTTDIALNVIWRPADKWTIKADLQSIKADSDAYDSTVATGIQMPKQTLDLTGDVPRLNFSAEDRAYLANRNNYFWGFTQEHGEKSDTSGKALKLDAKVDFDHKVLQDIRFGVRFTDRDATTTNTNPKYNWKHITQTWSVGWDVPHLAYMSDPRFAGNNYVHTFDNFFNGKVDVPQLVFPTLDMATGYPASYALLHAHRETLCREINTNCSVWAPASFGVDPKGTNEQSERTGAFFTQARFGFNDLRWPVDGNIGIRYVKTDNKAHGYTVFNTNTDFRPGTIVTGVPVPKIPTFAKAQEYENSYHNVLPSLNLRMKASEQLQFRFGFASALSRPDFYDMQGYTTLSQDVKKDDYNPVTNTQNVTSMTLTGEASGNPSLKPITSRQLDLTAEWYFSPVGSLTLSVFNKELKDIIVKQMSTYQIPDANGAMQTFNVTAPVNGAKGNARGFEVAYQQYFDKLPGWMSGFGVQANFTFVDSKTRLYTPVYDEYCAGGLGGDANNLNLNINGCDTDGRAFGNLPLQGMSRRSYNLAFIYDKGPFSSRLAYNWRSKSLQGVNANGTRGGDGLNTNPNSPTFGSTNVSYGLPTWADDYGQLDASIFYKISEKLSFGLEAQNLTDSTYRQVMDQHIGTKGRAWFVSGPRVTAQVRYTF